MLDNKFSKTPTFPCSGHPQGAPWRGCKGELADLVALPCLGTGVATGRVVGGGAHASSLCSQGAEGSSRSCTGWWGQMSKMEFLGWAWQFQIGCRMSCGCQQPVFPGCKRHFKDNVQDCGMMPKMESLGQTSKIGWHSTQKLKLTCEPRHAGQSVHIHISTN